MTWIHKPISALAIVVAFGACLIGSSVTASAFGHDHTNASTLSRVGLRHTGICSYGYFYDPWARRCVRNHL